MLTHNDRSNDRNEDTTLEQLESWRKEELAALLTKLEDGPTWLQDRPFDVSIYEAGCCFVDPTTTEIHVRTDPYIDLSYRAYYLDRGEVRLGREYIHEDGNTTQIKLFNHSDPPVIILSQKQSNTAGIRKLDSELGPSSGCLDHPRFDYSYLSILCPPNDLIPDKFYSTGCVGRHQFYDRPLRLLLRQFGLRLKENYRSQRLDDRFKLIRLTDGEAI